MKISSLTLKSIEKGRFGDKELKEALKFWKNMHEGLACLGPKWHLATKAAREELDYLERIATERKRK